MPGPALSDVLDSVTAEWRERLAVPGVAAAIASPEGEHVRGFGVTNAEHALPVDGETLFQIASITKTFTATALLRLEEEGRLELASPVRRHLPGFTIPDAAVSDRVRVEDLLTHMGGWDGDRFFARPPEEPSLARLVADLRDGRQLVPPRTSWSYNNAGFSVAGYLIERITGAPYADAIRELLLEPLGLRRSFFRADQVVTHRIAAGHLVVDGRAIVLRGGGWQPLWELLPSDAPAGGMISCASDLLAWSLFHLGDGTAPDGTRLLRADTLERMRAPLHDRGNDRSAMGLGWLLSRRGEVDCFGHSGSTVGYLSEIEMVARSRFALVLLTNAVHGAHLIREVRDRLLNAAVAADVAPPERIPAFPDDLSQFVGTYEGPFWRHRVREGSAPGELVLENEVHPPDPRRWQPPPSPPSTLAFYAPDRLVVVAPDAARNGLVEFGRDGAGQVAWLRTGLRIAPRS